MNREKNTFWIIFIFLLLSIQVACSSSGSHANSSDTATHEQNQQNPTDPDEEEPPRRDFIAGYDKGWLELESGHYILHLEGSAYEMGYQHGILLKDQVIENMSQVTSELLGGADFNEETKKILNEVGPLLLGVIGEIMEPFIPDMFRQELRGLCDATGVPYLKAIGLHTFLDSTDYLSSLFMRIEDTLDRHSETTLLKDIDGIDNFLSDVPQLLKNVLLNLDCKTMQAFGSLPAGGCTIFGAWGNATDSGKTIFARGLDFPWMPTLMKNSVLTLYKPDKGLPFASLGWAGYIGGLTGINVSGLTFGETTCTSKSATLLGRPFFLLCREVLQFSTSIDEALKLIENTPRTTGYTMMVTDPVSGGTVAEQSGGIVWGHLLSENPCGPFFVRTENIAPQKFDERYSPYKIYTIPQSLVTANCAVTPYRHISWEVNARYSRVMQQFNYNLEQNGHVLSVDKAKELLLTRYGLDNELSGDGHIFRRDGDPISHGTLQDSVYVADDLDMWVDANHSETHAEAQWIHINLKEEFSLGIADRDDCDGDGISNVEEALIGTHKNIIDSDGDGLTDGEEISLGYNPLQVDSDGDAKTDWAEYMDWPELVGETIERYTGIFGEASVEEFQADYGDLYLVKVKGRPYETGYQMGYLMGAQIRENYYIFVDFLLEEIGVEGESAQTMTKLIENALDLIALNMLPFTPACYYEEARGMEDGARSRGVDMDYMMPIRMVTLANAAEIYIPEIEVPWREPVSISIPVLQCSFFAAWGPRTQAGRTLATRNLDWVEDTGIARNRMITLYQPDDGIPYAILGWTGFFGAIAGMNANGICVAEIGSHNQVQSIWGIPWTLRLREVLSKGKDLTTARNVFESCPNTQGFNFMIADGDPDGWREGHYLPGAWAIETNAFFSGFFGANDMDENQAMYNGESYALRLD